MDKQEALNYESLSLNFISVTPDDHPVVGPLRHYPNVFVNGGHGQRQGGLAFVTGKMVAERVEGRNGGDGGCVEVGRYYV